MNILEITVDMFPLYIVQSRAKGELSSKMWKRFTVTPFEDKDKALKHLTECVAEYGGHGEFQVEVYTVEDWRLDVLAAVVKDADAVLRGLSILRTETLVDLLK